MLDELALDPRGYDFAHPVDKRPNYCFGEWDPHHIDNQGNYRRFVIRQIILEGLWQRVAAPAEAAPAEAAPARDELLFEAAAVLACTILMAAGVQRQRIPTTYDSTVNLGNLIPRIAKYREAFYAGVLGTIQRGHAERLREEMAVTRQPFGGASANTSIAILVSSAPCRCSNAIWPCWSPISAILLPAVASCGALLRRPFDC